MEMIKDQDTEEHGVDEEWTDLINRGGLWHVKETTYQFFNAIEDVVRHVLKVLVHPLAPSKHKEQQPVMMMSSSTGFLLLLILKLITVKFMPFYYRKYLNSM